MLIAHSVGLEAHDRDIAIEFESGSTDVIHRLGQAVQAAIDPLALAARIPAKRTKKFDHLMADQLLVRSLAHDAIDVSAAVDAIRSLETPAT